MQTQKGWGASQSNVPATIMLDTVGWQDAMAETDFKACLQTQQGGFQQIPGAGGYPGQGGGYQGGGGGRGAGGY